MSVDQTTRLKPFVRRSSTASSTTSFSSASSSGSPSPSAERYWTRSPPHSGKVKKPSSVITILEESEQAHQLLPAPSQQRRPPPRASKQETPETSWESLRATPIEKNNPRVTVEQPTPERGRSSGSAAESPRQNIRYPGRPDGRLNKALRPTIAVRRHSPIPDTHTRLFSVLHSPEQAPYKPSHSEYLSSNSSKLKMPHHKKIWVKRPTSSATQVAIGEEDLVDDVRDMILKKYANSLGRNYDPPDVTLRLIQRKYAARHSNPDRTLGPEENVFRLLDMTYPGGQTVEEAFIIDVPQRRTPKHSPRLPMPYYMSEGLRPGENQTDYFPIMPAGPSSPSIPSTFSVAGGQAGLHRQNSHAIAILETGQLPDLPSPGSRMTRHSHRPKFGRQHTSSPIVTSGNTNGQNIENLKGPNPQPLPTPPLPTDLATQRVGTPPPRTSSPRPSKPPKRSRKSPSENPTSSLATAANLLDNTVPPINVLVVEDNIINLKLLEAFLKRLKVRWSTAMNGRDALTRWREGGFHLVLMDIQLPIMNGLDATKEIRRLEKVNDIGVFTSSASSTPTFANGEVLADTSNDGKPQLKAEDSLMNTSLFKSPVIIVALTASSLQSDRHEALAAGCNDFLTKPVNFDWLSRKVTEWGCMQALIDFDGWRKWRDFSSTTTTTASNGKDHSKQLSAIKTKATPPQPSGSTKDTLSPRSAAAAATTNGQPPTTGGGPKSKRAHLLQPSLDGIGEEGSRERSTSDETDNTTDSNTEDGGSKAVAVGA